MFMREIACEWGGLSHRPSLFRMYQMTNYLNQRIISSFILSCLMGGLFSVGAANAQEWTLENGGADPVAIAQETSPSGSDSSLENSSSLSEAAVAACEGQYTTRSKQCVSAFISKCVWVIVYAPGGGQDYTCTQNGEMEECFAAAEIKRERCLAESRDFVKDRGGYNTKARKLANNSNQCKITKSKNGKKTKSPKSCGKSKGKAVKQIAR